MNKRIKELSDRAGINLTPAQFSGVLADNIDEFELEKFAELIVRECAGLADDLGVHLAGHQDKDGRDIAYSIRDTIKEHFGVEK